MNAKTEPVYIDIKFWTMVVLLIKFALAIIPAALILMGFSAIMVATAPGVTDLIKAMFA